MPTGDCSGAGLADSGRRVDRPNEGQEVLRVVGITELTAAHGPRFRKQVRAALNGHTVIEIDLSRTTSMDCAGLGALLALRQLTRQWKGFVRLLNPSSCVRQLLDLLRARQIFEIVNTSI